MCLTCYKTRIINEILLIQYRTKKSIHNYIVKCHMAMNIYQCVFSASNQK